MSDSSMKCAFCGADAIVGNSFCTACGKPLTPSAQPDSKPEQNAPPAPVTVYVEPPAAFVAGLPAWNIEPPSVVVRRKARI